MSILDAIPSESSVSFAADAAPVPVAQAIRELLKEQPKVISFGALDLPEGGQARPRRLRLTVMRSIATSSTAITRRSTTSAPIRAPPISTPCAPFPEGEPAMQYFLPTC